MIFFYSPWQLKMYVEPLAGVALYVSVMLPVVAVFSPVTLATVPVPPTILQMKMGVSGQVFVKLIATVGFAAAVPTCVDGPSVARRPPDYFLGIAHLEIGCSHGTAQIRRGNARPHPTPMIRRPSHLRPILYRSLIEHEIAAFQHAQIGIGPHPQRALPRPQPMQHKSTRCLACRTRPRNRTELRTPRKIHQIKIELSRLPLLLRPSRSKRRKQHNNR